MVSLRWWCGRSFRRRFFGKEGRGQEVEEQVEAEMEEAFGVCVVVRGDVGSTLC